MSVKNIMTAISDYFYELIRSPDKLEVSEEGLLFEEMRESLTPDELIWIFESLSKDTT